MGYSTPVQATNEAGVAVFNSLLYADFASDTAALAAKPVAGFPDGVYIGTDNILRARSPWSELREEPPAGRERYACQVFSRRYFGHWSPAFITDPIQETNNNAGYQYSSDGSAWSSTRANNSQFGRRFDPTTGTWGPAFELGDRRLERGTFLGGGTTQRLTGTNFTLATPFNPSDYNFYLISMGRVSIGYNWHLMEGRYFRLSDWDDRDGYHENEVFRFTWTRSGLAAAGWHHDSDRYTVNYDNRHNIGWMHVRFIESDSEPGMCSSIYIQRLSRDEELMGFWLRGYSL